MANQFTPQQQETLTAIVDTFVGAIERDDDADGFFAAKGSDVGADIALQQHLAEFPAEQFAELTNLIDALAMAGMTTEPLATREAILGNAAGTSPEAGVAVKALYSLSVLLAYGLADAEGRNPLWPGMGYPGPISAPPATHKPLTCFKPMGDTTLDADVVVIGSGSGGGVAAAVLAAAGKRVVIVEKGSYRNESDFVQVEIAAYQNLFLRGGFFPTADGMVSIAAGSTVGGGSTINWSNSIKTPTSVRQAWASDFGLADVADETFDDHINAVWERIACNDKVAFQNGPHQRLSAGAEALGFAYRTTYLNIDPEKFDPAQIGYSGMGDQTGAKQGTMRTFLQDASDNGAQLLPNTSVAKILTSDGAATGVQATYVDPESQDPYSVTITAPSVVVAAGSLETPALLLRSGIGGPAVGQDLRLHPATLVSGIYDEPQESWFGPAMAGIMTEFAEAHDGCGYLIESVQHLPGLFTTTVPWLSAEQHKELAKQYRNRADWVVLVKDRSGGSVTIDENGEAVHWYPLGDELDQRHLHEGVENSIRMHVAAGARQIYAAGQPFEPWQQGDDVEEFIAKVNELPLGPGGMPLFSAHQMSSAKLGADPNTAVAKPSGELHDTKGVWIADASGMPTSSGVNPMVTVMALARRTAMNMLA